ncbi:hypothetical protein Tco_1096395 [Tanacetum coccineum]
MFMVRKRLRNGQRYGFVRFKFVVDANELLKRLRKIKVEDEFLRVFIAFDRRNPDTRFKVRGEMNDNIRQKIHAGVSGGGGKMGTCDNRRYVDVVHGSYNAREKMERPMARSNGARWIQTEKDDQARRVVEEGEGRIIDVGEEAFNMEVFSRSLIGEVKKECYIPKLLAFCDEQGLHKVEVKF